MMSSDSSEISKDQKEKYLRKPRKIIKTSSGESTGNLSVQKNQQPFDTIKDVNSIPRQTVTVLEQLNYPSKLDSYEKELSKKTATTHNSTSTTVITAVLRDLSDDIIHTSAYQQPGPESLVNGNRAIAVIGGDNVYIQSKTKFLPVPREKIFSSHPDKNDSWMYKANRSGDHSPVDVAVSVQRMFTPLSSICFGLLGGAAFLQLIMMQHLTNQDQMLFLQSYSRFSEITPVIFYILLAVCLISAVDRIPMKQQAVVCPPSWIVAAVYVATLLLTLSCTTYDNMIALYLNNEALLHDQMKVGELVSKWQVLNTLRCLFAVSGWIIYSLTTPADLLLEHLVHISQYEPRNSPVLID